ncbi:MAG TPA: chorismate mutase [Thermoanaerobaculia bacterium]|nr:chorismate mutase [Thermoanaerobaculia bacterium]
MPPGAPAERDGPAVAEAAIERLRRNIDAVDEVVVKLLNQRAKWAQEIGVVKKGAGIAIYQPDREARVVAHVVAANRGPLEAAAVQRLFERIIDESRRLERTAEPEGAK